MKRAHRRVAFDESQHLPGAADLFVEIPPVGSAIARLLNAAAKGAHERRVKPPDRVPIRGRLKRQMEMALLAQQRLKRIALRASSGALVWDARDSQQSVARSRSNKVLVDEGQRGGLSSELESRAQFVQAHSINFTHLHVRAGLERPRPREAEDFVDAPGKTFGQRGLGALRVNGGENPLKCRRRARSRSRTRWLRRQHKRHHVVHLGHEFRLRPVFERLTESPIGLRIAGEHGGHVQPIQEGRDPPARVRLPGTSQDHVRRSERFQRPGPRRAGHERA